MVDVWELLESVAAKAARKAHEEDIRANHQRREHDRTDVEGMHPCQNNQVSDDDG